MNGRQNDFCFTSNTGQQIWKKHEHSDFDPSVEKLTSGSSNKIISHFGRINFVAVMLPKISSMIRIQIVFMVCSSILFAIRLKFLVPLSIYGD